MLCGMLSAQNIEALALPANWWDCIAQDGGDPAVFAMLVEFYKIPVSSVSRELPPPPFKVVNISEQILWAQCCFYFGAVPLLFWGAFASKNKTSGNQVNQ